MCAWFCCNCARAHTQVVELPMLHPEKFVALGIDPPKVGRSALLFHV